MQEIGQDKPVHLSTPSIHSLLSVQRDFWYISVFCSKISYIDINYAMKDNNANYLCISLCLLLYLITFGLKFITLLSQAWQIIPVCCLPREQTPGFSLRYTELFARSHSINAETQENSGRHLPRGEGRRRAGFALECWYKRLSNCQHRNARWMILNFQIWA